MTYIVKEDTFRANITDLLPLFEEHFHECQFPGGPESVDVNIEHYMYMESIDCLKCFSVKQDGKIVGYISGSMFTHPHHKDELFYTTDTVFILPEHRKGSAGIKLIKHAEKVMKEKYNVKYFGIDWSTHNDSVGELLKKMGYTHASVMSCKKL